MSETWVAVGDRWQGHRAEPLIHERVWGCALTGSGPNRAGFDADGRAVAWRQERGYEERVSYEPGRIVVRTGEHVVVETELDGAGRPIRSVYARGGEERYHYDDDGRLVVIDEAAALADSVSGPVRYTANGPLAIEYDARGLCAIRGEHELVWERCDEPWQELLARGADELAGGFAAAIAEAEPDGAEVFALSLTYVADGAGLHSVVSLGLEEERRGWTDPYEFALASWYLVGDRLGEIDDYSIPEKLENLLVREVALNDPDDPVRTVLNAVAARLARRDWQGLFTPTEDFVAFIAEHDEGFSEKHASVRAVNPPERLAAWDARWPAGAERDD